MEEAGGSRESRAEEPERRGGSWLFALAAGAASGALAALTYPPAALSWLAWVSLVPLLAFLRWSRGSRAVVAFAAFGLVYFSIGLFWLHTVITVFGPTVLAAVLTLLYCVPLAVVLGRLTGKGHSLLYTAPLAWAAFDWVRSVLFTGFPWIFLAHSQAGFTTLIQIADLFGAYGVTALIVLANAALVEAGFMLRAGRRGAAVLSLAPALALLVAALVYGGVRRPSVDLEDGPSALLVQGNIPQYMKNEAFQPAGGRGEILSGNYMLRRYLELTRLGLEKHPEVEAVFWPETMFPYDISDAPEERDQRAAIERFVEGRFARTLGGRPAIVGAVYRSKDGRRFNSAFLVTPNGRLGGRYDKVHAVPGGEYIPLRTLAPEALLKSVGEAIQAAAGFIPDLSEGDDLVELEAAGLRCFPLICYEIMYPELSRRAVNLGGDVLLNLTNYGWFPGTGEPEQATQSAVFRAVENRRPVVIAANTGMSVVVDPRGEVTGGAATWYHEGDSGPERLLSARGGSALPKETAGFAAVAIPRSGAWSLYRVWGDVPWILALALLLVGLFVRGPKRTDGAVRKPGSSRQPSSSRELGGRLRRENG